MPSSSSSSSSSFSTFLFPASLFPSSSSLETFVLALAMTVGLLQLAITKADCPETCSCKWKGGKQTVECVNASLSAIPNIEKDTQVLDLSHNYLPILPMDIFLTLHLPNLQKIYLARSSVKTVADHCFRGLTNLIELDLSHNGLSSVPRFTTDDCKYLMRLSLKGNQIREIPNEAFLALRDLNSLDLGECGLEFLGETTFRDLENLEYLRLENNRLRSMDPAQSFPPKLRDLTLHGNRWHCDCQMLSMHRWLRNFSVPYSVEPKCHSPPRIINEEITKLPDTEFACIPEVSPTSMYLEVIEGKNMSLVCSVKAIPEAQVVWRYRDTYINNGSTLIDDIDMRHYFYIQSVIKPSHIKSELFLSSTTTDDNGTFACIAENKAGRAMAQFTLHVVVPMPPKPPQDVVEERFNMEYIIAIVIAGALIVLIAFVIVTLTALRCKRQREKRRRKRSLEHQQQQQQQQQHQQQQQQQQHSNKAHLVRSKSGGEISCADSLSTQMTASITSGNVHISSSNTNGGPSSNVVSANHHHHNNHPHHLYHNDYQQQQQSQQPHQSHLTTASKSNSQSSITDLTSDTKTCATTKTDTSSSSIGSSAFSNTNNSNGLNNSKLLTQGFSSSTAAASALSGRDEMKLALSNAIMMTGDQVTSAGISLDEREDSNSSASLNDDQDSYHETTLHQLSHLLPQQKIKALAASGAKSDTHHHRHQHSIPTHSPHPKHPQHPQQPQQQQIVQHAQEFQSSGRPPRSSSFDLIQSAPKATGAVQSRASTAPGLQSQLVALSPPTPFADDSYSSSGVKDHSSCLRSHNNKCTSRVQGGEKAPHPKHFTMKKQSSQPSSSSSSPGNNLKSSRQCRTMPRKLAKDGSRVLPPPPQYKGVHFAPNVRNNEDKSTPNFVIPTEGLPTRPARGQPSDHMVIISSSSETVPIVVRSKNGPPTMLKPFQTSSSMTFTSIKDENGPIRGAEAHVVGDLVVTGGGGGIVVVSEANKESATAVTGKPAPLKTQGNVQPSNPCPTLPAPKLAVNGSARDESLGSLGSEQNFNENDLLNKTPFASSSSS